MDISILSTIETIKSDIRNLTIQLSMDEKNWDVENLLLEKKQELNSIRRNKTIQSKAVSAFDLIRDVNDRPSIPRYATGVAALDAKLNGGIEIGSFVQLAGASFAGKTHLAIEILSTIANREKVLFFNFEMGDRRIAHRFEKSLNTNEAKKNMMIHNDNRELTHIIDEIKSAHRNGIKFFGIDSKMKIEVSTEKEDYKKFSKISATLSKLTQENEIIIFLINQISEDDDKTGRHSFKGSGDQLYDTDLALFYVIDKDNLNVRKLVCRKNRQDENNFTLTLKLDNNNKTVLADDSEVVYQDSSNRYTSKPQVYEYKETATMTAI